MASIPFCTIVGCEEHYGCRLRNKGIQVSPQAQTTRTQNWRPTVDRPPAHYGNIVYDERPGGYKMPLIDGKTGDVVRHRQAQQHEHRIAEHMRLIRQRDTTTTS